MSRGIASHRPIIRSNGRGAVDELPLEGLHPCVGVSDQSPICVGSFIASGLQPRFDISQPIQVARHPAKVFGSRASMTHHSCMLSEQAHGRCVTME